MKELETPYDAIGGYEFLDKLVDTFYKNVQDEPILAPLFPNDLTETARKQKQFLTQFLGGPTLYSDEHGHPMLRARHMPFTITPKHAEAWLTCMRKAMDEVKFTGELREQIYARLTFTAHHMVNHPNDPQSEGG
ncbi:globin [Bacillus alkalicellulosilyticus]|uniref:globin domain-containing protein n=1 Tax=Alkalihalobacterium alkalicellulosilyticum TaxID=1912214 RepID=UPI000998003A|nr:globin [Bacillus alkalicellulosilyticus]